MYEKKKYARGFPLFRTKQNQGEREQKTNVTSNNYEKYG